MLNAIRIAAILAVAVLLLVLNPAGTSRATPGAGGGPTVFSVSSIGPTHDITPAAEAGSGFGLTCTSSDVLAVSVGGAPCAARPAPAPAGPVPRTATVTTVDFGLNLGGPFTDDLDGLSFGERLGVVATADYDFSVDAAPANGGATVGAPLPPACAAFVPNVTSESAALEAQGDIFTTAGAPAGCNVQAPGCGGLCDEGAPAMGLIAPNAAAPGVPPLDNVDALAQITGLAGPCTYLGGAVVWNCSAFTVSAGSAVLGAIPLPPATCGIVGPATGATILVPPGTPNPGGTQPCLPPAGCPAGGTPCIAVPAFYFLLGAGDDIDALCWFDVNGNGVPDLPLGTGGGADKYMFSLTPGSASVPFFSPADVLGRRGPTTFSYEHVIRTAASLGLLATDNVDGLICHQTDVDGDNIPEDLDDCPSVANGGQEDYDNDGLGDVCDPDADDDGVNGDAESNCGSHPLDAGSIPERLDGAFAGVDDDDNDGADEPLPPGSESYDCDRDGYTGTAEAHVYVTGASTAPDQDPCGVNAKPPTDPPSPNTGWPSDLHPGDMILPSVNRITAQDLQSFLAPVRYLDSDLGDILGNVRWDLIPGPGVLGTDINAQDYQALIAGATANSPMLGGVRALDGPDCPWPP